MRRNRCRHCNKVLKGKQKNRKFCNRACNLAWRNRYKNEIKRLRYEHHELHMRFHRLERNWLYMGKKSRSIKWLLRQLFKALLRMK